MAYEPTITVIGNLGSDAEFRKTPKGTPVTSFNLANTTRKFTNNEWVDGETTWFRVFVWNKDAAGTANTLRKGDKVIVTGRFAIDKYVTKDGEERQSLEITAETVGVIPKYAPEPVALQHSKSDEEPVEEFPW